MGVNFNPLIFSGFDFTGGGAAGAAEWREPVANEAALPLVGNSNGEARVTLDTDKIYVWDATSSRWIDTGITAAAFGSAPNANGQTIGVDDSTANIRRRTITLQPADATNPGGLSITTQSIAGAKTFLDPITGDVNYTPANSNDWASPVPTMVAGALDTLADRIVSYGVLTKEPTGFENRTDSSLSFADGSRTFTIQPTGVSFDYYVKGRKFTITTAQSIVLPNSPGDHYIYFNELGNLSSTQIASSDLYQNNALISIVYWNTDTNTHTYFAEERHGLVMDGATHTYLHTVFGARYLSGLALQNFTIGTGSANADAQFNADQGSIRDEDILIQIPAAAQIPILYRQGTQWRKKTADSFPVIYSGTAGYTGANGRLPYNQLTGGIWQLTQVQNNKYVLVHFFGTNDIENGIVGIQGIAQYDSMEAARTAANAEISSLSGLPFAEFVAIGTVLFQTSNTFANTPKADVVPVDGSNYVDFRGTQLYTPAGNATTHSLLSGLAADDHFQYLLADGTRSMSGALDMGTHEINNVVDPTLAQDAATKNYVDNEVSTAVTGTTSFFAGFDSITGILTEVPGYTFDDNGALQIGAQNSLTIPPGITDYTSIGISPTVSNSGLVNLTGVQLNTPVNNTVTGYAGFQVFGYGTNAPASYTGYLSQPGYSGTATNVTHFFAAGSVDASGTISGFEFSPSGNASDIKVFTAAPTGNATNGIGFNYTPSGTYTTLTGISVDLSAAVTTDRNVGLNITEGTLSSSITFSTVSNLPTLVDSGNVLRPIFEVQSGVPITGTDVLMTNLAGFMDIKDDYSGSPLNIGVSSVGFVSQVAVDSGKTASNIAMLTAGLAVDATSAGGTVTDAQLIKAFGSNFGGSLNIGTLYGLQIQDGISALATNSFGLSVEDDEAENYLAKSLKISGVTKVVSDASIGLEIDGIKSLKLAVITTAQRSALPNVLGTIVYDSDLNLFFGNDGSEWIALNLSKGDIGQSSFPALDNQAVASNITGFAFSNAVTRGFEAQVTVVRGSTYAEYCLKGIQKASSWEMSQDYIGDDTGISFNITSLGQIQYTSTSTGTNASLLFRAQTV